MSIKVPRIPDDVARPLPPVGTARPLEPTFPAARADFILSRGSEPEMRKPAKLESGGPPDSFVVRKNQ